MFVFKHRCKREYGPRWNPQVSAGPSHQAAPNGGSTMTPNFLMAPQPHFQPISPIYSSSWDVAPWSYNMYLPWSVTPMSATPPARSTMTPNFLMAPQSHFQPISPITPIHSSGEVAPWSYMYLPWSVTHMSVTPPPNLNRHEPKLNNIHPLRFSDDHSSPSAFGPYKKSTVEKDLCFSMEVAESSKGDNLTSAADFKPSVTVSRKIKRYFKYIDSSSEDESYEPPQAIPPLAVDQEEEAEVADIFAAKLDSDALSVNSQLYESLHSTPELLEKCIPQSPINEEFDSEIEDILDLEGDRDTSDIRDAPLVTPQHIPNDDLVNVIEIAVIMEVEEKKDLQSVTADKPSVIGSRKRSCPPDDDTSTMSHLIQSLEWMVSLNALLALATRINMKFISRSTRRSI